VRVQLPSPFGPSIFDAAIFYTEVDTLISATSIYIGGHIPAQISAWAIGEPLQYHNLCGS
jgi:hypothetical protein